MQESTIPELVEGFRNKKFSRRRFVRHLSAMGISAVGISAIMAASSSPVDLNPVHHENGDEDAAKHLQRHDQHIAHQTQGNAGALHNDYAEHAVVEDSMYDEPFVGRTAIMARKNVVIAAASSPEIKLLNRMVHGTQVTVEWVASGVHTGDLPGLPASGRSFSIHGVTVVIREDGKIVRESLYYDAAELRRQLSKV